MKQLRKNQIKACLVLSFTLLLASCGKAGSRVKDVVVKSEYIESDVHLSLSIEWDMGNIGLPQITLPIYMPKTWNEIGVFSMSPVLSGNTLLHVNVNLSEITAKIKAEQATLPNGAMLPLIGLTKTIVIPIKDKVTIYLTLGDGVAAIGLAANIKGMDAMGARVGTSVLSPVFNIKNVAGSAGIYTSANAGQNGIGFFADLSQVIDPVTFIDLGLASEQEVMFAKSFGKIVELKQLKLNPIYPSKKKAKKIKSELEKLNKNNAQLVF